MQFGVLTKLGGVLLRKPSQIAFVMQELQQEDKMPPKPQIMDETKKMMLLLLLLLLMMMTCLCL
jgi:hypothetical protein